MSKIKIWRFYKLKILLWVFVLSIILIAINFGIDKKIVLFTTLVFGVFTQLFAGLGSIIALIPVVGPLIIKIVTIPGFFLLNAMGTIISGVAIKKGYSSQLAKGRIITLALMIGIIIGYIIGNLIPLK
tara:strand:- start:1373 stop:1756 length:384 start_codon:yes stop_codon:yes gene_type:complete